jgi:hypothetical protein
MSTDDDKKDDDKKANAVEVYRKRLLEHRESEAKVKNCMYCFCIV